MVYKRTVLERLSVPVRHQLSLHLEDLILLHCTLSLESDFDSALFPMRGTRQEQHRQAREQQRREAREAQQAAAAAAAKGARSTFASKKHMSSLRFYIQCFIITPLPPSRELLVKFLPNAES